eukprot:7383804-Prymnesium_polylepis.2
MARLTLGAQAKMTSNAKVTADCSALNLRLPRTYASATQASMATPMSASGIVVVKRRRVLKLPRHSGGKIEPAQSSPSQLKAFITCPYESGSFTL